MPGQTEHIISSLRKVPAFISLRILWRKCLQELTAGAGYLNYSPSKAYKAIKETILPDFTRIPLVEGDYLHVLERMKKLTLKGGIIYDALISRAADNVDAVYLVTFNKKDFTRVCPENGADLVIPS